MDRYLNRPHGRDAPDEELIDYLIAVSIIAKRLAEKLRQESESRETKNGKLQG